MVAGSIPARGSILMSRTFIEGIALSIFEINPLPRKRYKIVIWRTRRGKMVTEILDGGGGG